MQLKNGNSVAMEKRVDLASLFCMIGRHGPAVAVAVIAVVSLLAGLIIYRNVKGKRRRATAEPADGDGKSRGAQRDESLLQPDTDTDTDTESESRGSVDSTGLSEEALPNIKNAALMQTELRNRHAAAEQKPQHYYPPKMSFEPDESHTSLLLNSANVAGSCAEETDTNLQVDLTGIDVDSGACQQDLKDVEEVCDDCSKPAEICESPEEVSESREEETVTDVSCEEILQKEASVMFEMHTPVSKQNFQTSQGKDGQKDGEPQAAIKSCMEDIIIVTDVAISVKEAEIKTESLHTDAVGFSDCDRNGPSPGEEMKNEELCRDDQLTALQHESEALQHEDVTEDDQTADCSLVSDVIEKDVGEDSLKVDVKVQKWIPEEKADPSTCGEHEEEKIPSSCGGLIEVLGPALPCLNQSADLGIELCGNGLCSPETGLGPIPDLAYLKENQSDGDAVEIESCEHLAFSFRHDQSVITCEKATFTDPEKTTEMFHSVLPSLQEEKFDQMQNIEAPDMTEGIKPSICQIQPLTFDQSELTWSSSGVGEESGISSMTISPDLQDPYEYDMTPEKLVLSVLHHYPQSEEQGETEGRFFSDGTVNESDQIIVPAVSSSQQCQSKRPDESPPAIEDAWDGAVGPSIVLVAESGGFNGNLKQDVDVKAEVLVEGAEKDAVKTEISIMEATMDNNEWITDGNYHVNPLIDFSVQSSAQNSQTDMVSMKEARSTLLPMESYTNADDPSSTEADQNDTLSLTDKDLENSRKIVAVQPMPQNVNVTFCTHYVTQSPYQKVAITGNQQELGNWKGFVPLQHAKDGHWATVVRLPAENHVEWKFVVVDKGQVCRWEECGNRLLDTGHGDDLHVHKWWGLM